MQSRDPRDCRHIHPDRIRAIWRWAAWGTPLVTIARQLGLARNTVKRHLRPDLEHRTKPPGP